MYVNSVVQALMELLAIKAIDEVLSRSLHFKRSSSHFRYGLIRAMVKIGFTTGTIDSIVITLRIKKIAIALFDPTSIVR